MALKVNSITAHFAKLSLGISRTSIRYNQTAAVIDAAREKEIARQKEIAKSTHAEGHGLNIWVFFHILDGFTVLQHTPIMKVRIIRIQLFVSLIPSSGRANIIIARPPLR